MKITIDTKHDTHEDIRKVLHILTHILENKESNAKLDSNFNINSNINSNPVTTEDKPAGFMNMFGDSSTSTPSDEPNQTEQETAPDFSNFMNLMNKKEDDGENKEEPKLEFF